MSGGLNFTKALILKKNLMKRLTLVYRLSKSLSGRLLEAIGLPGLDLECRREPGGPFLNGRPFMPRFGRSPEDQHGEQHSPPRQPAAENTEKKRSPLGAGERFPPLNNTCTKDTNLSNTGSSGISVVDPQIWDLLTEIPKERKYWNNCRKPGRESQVCYVIMSVMTIFMDSVRPRRARPNN
jgi:hypothetical protein